MKPVWLTLFAPATEGDYFRFAAPQYLWGLLAIPILWLLFEYLDRHPRVTLRFATIQFVKTARPSSGRWHTRAMRFFRILSIALCVLALARPQYGRVERKSFSEGIDIMLVLDVSGSMRSQDFVPNRLEAAKEVLKEFVADRQGDRIGLVIFASTAAALVPLTLDHLVVQQFIERVRFGLLDENSTAIGLGIMTGLKKLERSDAKSKIMILLTDGQNNAGNVDPLTAAEAARAMKVRIYTIGVGTENVPAGLFGFTAPDAGLDEKTLKAIATKTGGLYFHATDNAKLHGIYEQIDKLEKTRIESTQFDNFNELAPWFLAGVLGVLVLEILFATTRGMRLPL